MGQRLSGAALTSWRPRARLAASLLFVSATTLCGAASADDSAADHAKRARTAYDLQDWPTAIQEYRAAYTADGKAELLFGLAQAQRQGGDFVGAIASFKAFKRSESVTETQATAAELLITKCEIEQAKKEAAEQRKSEPAPAPAPVPPPSTTETPPPPPRQPKRFYEDVLGDVLSIGGLAVVGVGAYFLGSGDTQTSGAANAATLGAYDQQVSGAKPRQVVGVVGLATGSALLAGGIWRYAVVAGRRGEPRDAKPASVSVSVTLAGSSRALIVRGAF